MRKKKEEGKREKEGEMKEDRRFDFDKFRKAFVLRWRKKREDREENDGRIKTA